MHFWFHVFIFKCNDNDAIFFCPAQNEVQLKYDSVTGQNIHTNQSENMENGRFMWKMTAQQCYIHRECWWWWWRWCWWWLVSSVDNDCVTNGYQPSQRSHSCTRVTTDQWFIGNGWTGLFIRNAIHARIRAPPPPPSAIQITPIANPPTQPSIRPAIISIVIWTDFIYNKWYNNYTAFKLIIRRTRMNAPWHLWQIHLNAFPPRFCICMHWNLIIFRLVSRWFKSL